MALTGAVGAINVRITAEIAQFKAAMSEVGNRLGATAAKARQSGNTYAKWGMVASAAAAAVGTAMVKNQMKVLDALAKTSDALGVQQKQLQALQHVAELTGTGAAQLSANLQRMQRRIGEVARKGGQAEAALKEIGIAAKDMIALPADEQLVRISQAMAGVDNASIRASIAMDLFGRDGVRMLKMMEQLGKDGIAPTVEELNQLGVALTRIETAKVEQANDTLFKTQQVMDGLVNKVAVKLSPLITALGEDFLDTAKKANGFDSTMVSVMKNTITVVGYFADALHGLKIIFKGLELAGKTMGLVIVEVFRFQAKAIEKLVNVAINGLNVQIAMINKIPGIGIPLIEKFESATVGMFTNMSNKAREEVSKISTELDNLAGGLLPSTKLDVWVANAEAAATRATNALNNTEGVGGGGSVGLTEDEKAQMQDKLTAISESLMSETELKRVALENDLAVLKEALANELIAKTEHDQQVKALKEKTSSEITDIENKAKKERDNLAKLEKDTKVNAVGDTFSALSTLMNSQSKKLFEIGKAAAIGSAIVDGYKAVAKTMSETPYPFNIPLAAAQAAASAVQVQGIAKQKFGGAGGGANQFSAGVPAVNTTSAAGAAGGGGDRNVSISGLDPSSMFSGEQVRDLLKNLAGDGADFTFLNGGG